MLINHQNTEADEHEGKGHDGKSNEFVSSEALGDFRAVDDHAERRAQCEDGKVAGKEYAGCDDEDDAEYHFELYFFDHRDEVPEGDNKNYGFEIDHGNVPFLTGAVYVEVCISV